MNRSEEEQPLEGQAALDRHVRELLEHTLRPMPPMATDLGRSAMNGAPPESVLDAYVYEDDEPKKTNPAQKDQ